MSEPSGDDPFVRARRVALLVRVVTNSASIGAILTLALVGLSIEAAVAIGMAAAYLLWDRYVVMPRLYRPAETLQYPLRPNFQRTEGQKDLTSFLVRRTVTVLSKRAGIPVPFASIIDDDRGFTAVAMLEHPHGHVMVARSLLVAEPEASVAALAHEIAHLALRHSQRIHSLLNDFGVMRSIAIACTLSALHRLLQADLSVESAAAMLLLFVISGLLSLLRIIGSSFLYALAHLQEYAADELGARLLGDHFLMAKCLATIAAMYDDPNEIETASRTHPSLGNRIRRLVQRDRGIRLARAESENDSP